MSEALSRTMALIPCGELIGKLKKYPGVTNENVQAFITAGCVRLFNDRYVAPILTVDDLAMITERNASICAGVAYDWLHEQYGIVHKSISRDFGYFDELRTDEYGWEGDCIRLDLSLWDEE
jgi:hypothetical protein